MPRTVGGHDGSCGCGSSAVLIADEFAEQQHLVLTANQDTPYMSGVLDLRNGPKVIELPAGLLGTLNNIWQQPLCDLGGPFSPEQNRGGRFLIQPPGYDGPLPEFHHHVVESDSNIVVFYLRAFRRRAPIFPSWSSTLRPTGSTNCQRRRNRRRPSSFP